MTEDFLERMHMADQDDDDPDLKQLKQLRQIWLAMPEEEPPTRGLDALLAAARTQAAALEPKPAWWQRMFAVLVRPPALALATIVVVAGGAVLVNRHHDELDATRPAALEAAGSAAAVAPATSTGRAQLEERGADLNALDPQQGLLDKGPAVEAPRRPAPEAPTKTGESGGATAAPSLVTAKPVPQIVHSAVAKKPPAARPPADKDLAPDKEDRPEHKPAPEPIEGNDVEAAPPKQIVLSHPPVANPTPAPAPPPPPPPGHASSGPRGGVTKSDGAQLATDNVDEAKAESVGSLLRRAHDAAVRGDCTSAKALATQISKLDLAYYRSTVLKDAVVAKCL